jgi:hypothetical protein
MKNSLQKANGLCGTSIQILVVEGYSFQSCVKAAGVLALGEVLGLVEVLGSEGLEVLEG